jgi:hypothetical protein
LALPDFLILIGPNAVGKSHVGAVLAANFICEFVSIERFFKNRYSTQAAFRADEAVAYLAFREYLLETLKQTGRPVVFEQVALSEHEQVLIAALQRDYRTVLGGVGRTGHQPPESPESWDNSKLSKDTGIAPPGKGVVPERGSAAIRVCDVCPQQRGPLR